jgi:hypothetical protein
MVMINSSKFITSIPVLLRDNLPEDHEHSHGLSSAPARLLLLTTVLPLLMLNAYVLGRA